MKKVIFFLLLFLPFLVRAEKIKSEVLFEDDTIWHTSDTFIGENGNIYLSGHEENGLIAILNSDYEEINRKDFDEYSVCMAVQVDEEENIYTLCDKRGFIYGFGITDNINPYTSVELVKLDKDLNVIYKKAFQNQYDQGEPFSMLIKNDKIYFITSEDVYDSYSREDYEYVYLNYLSNYYLYIADLDGEIIKRVPLTSDYPFEYSLYKNMDTFGYGHVFSRYHNIISSGDYLYICAGDIVSKVDYSGNIVWSRDYYEEYGIIGSKIAETNDGNIIYGGNVEQGNSLSIIDAYYAPVLAILDSNRGKIIDYKIFDLNSYGEILTVDNKDNGYYVSFNLGGAIEGINDSRGIYFAKLDYNLNIKDAKKVEKEKIFYTGDAKNGIYSYEGIYLVNYYSDFSGDISTEHTLLIDETISIATVLGVDLPATEWAIDDPSIIGIEDGNIIPKKIGSTYIRSTYEGNDYSIKITVVDADKEEPIEDNKEDNGEKDNKIINPNTNDYIIITSILLVASLIIALLASKKYYKRTFK